MRRGGRGEVAARRAPATRPRSRRPAHGGVTISSCAAGSSSLKRGSPSTRSSTSRALRQQVERLAVEQEQLLLDADRRARRARRSVRAAASAITWPSRRARAPRSGRPGTGSPRRQAVGEDLGVVLRHEADLRVRRPPAARVGRRAVDDREADVVGGQRGLHQPHAVGVAEPGRELALSPGRFGWKEPDPQADDRTARSGRRTCARAPRPRPSRRRRARPGAALRCRRAARPTGYMPDAWVELANTTRCTPARRQASKTWNVAVQVRPGDLPRTAPRRPPRRGGRPHRRRRPPRTPRRSPPGRPGTRSPGATRSSGSRQVGEPQLRHALAQRGPQDGADAPAGAGDEHTSWLHCGSVSTCVREIPEAASGQSRLVQDRARRPTMVAMNDASRPDHTGPPRPLARRRVRRPRPPLGRPARRACGSASCSRALLGRARRPRLRGRVADPARRERGRRRGQRGIVAARAGLRRAARAGDAGRAPARPRRSSATAGSSSALAAAVLVGTLAGWARLGPAWALLPIGALVLPSVALARRRRADRAERARAVVVAPRDARRAAASGYSSGLGPADRRPAPHRAAGGGHDPAADRRRRAAHADRAPARPLRARRVVQRRRAAAAAARARCWSATANLSTPQARPFGARRRRRLRRRATAPGRRWRRLRLDGRRARRARLPGRRRPDVPARLAGLSRLPRGAAGHDRPARAARRSGCCASGARAARTSSVQGADRPADGGRAPCTAKR